MRDLTRRAVGPWLLKRVLIFGLIAIQAIVVPPSIVRAEPRVPPQVQRPPDISIERLERPGRSRKAEPIDINSASANELQTLPGIGKDSAKKIVEGRPYKHTDELVQKHILPQATYDQIKDAIAAKQR
ncbi:MAG: ComEA family DNA-binding protein [Nitrospiraceae bacterium]